MTTQFEEGHYLVRVVSQYFTKSVKKETRGFVLAFRVLHNLNQPETAVKPYQRDTTWWITDKTFKRVLHDLQTLGYEGTDFKGVHPKTESFHDFRGQEIELICTHETNDKGEKFEQWSFQNGKLKLDDPTELDYFDRLLSPERERAKGGIEAVGDLGITDEDVPF